MLYRLLVAIAGALLIASSASAKPPLEAFGDMPTVRAVDISPDGNLVAFLQRIQGVDALVIHDFRTDSTKALARVEEIKARDVHFAGNDYVILIASTDTKTFGFRGRYEFSAAFAFDLKTGKSTQLLRNTDNLYPAQSGLGNIVGMEPGGKAVFMPAYMGSVYDTPTLDIVRVPLESGRGARTGGARGTQTTIDWIVNKDGVAIVRESHSTKNEDHTISVRDAANGAWRDIYNQKGPLPTISLVGLAQDGKSLVVVDARESEFMSLYTMSMADGAISEPLMQRADAEVVNVLTDLNRIVYGVRYSGMRPTYEMFDADIEMSIKAVQAHYRGSSVDLVSWSSDWSKLVFYVQGGDIAERYMLYDRRAKQLKLIADSRPDIAPEDVGEVITVEYKARDGLAIPSLITWPTGVDKDNRKNLPLIVMPHGGPEAYDSVGFDWLAQYLANEGYMVLQPNFRGSAGFGEVFASAGHGEWGRKMQDDISDGAIAMAKMGWADPERVCIVGWSYGGYAALAGGVLTPDLYKCVVSIAGVSNLRDMLYTERQQHGPRSRTVTYWEMLIGDPDKDREAIDTVSPALHADKFKAPVLLVHGASDTVVPERQSEMMNDALRRADKPVQYMRIEGDDHSLVDNESRRKVLTVLGDFLKTHIGE